MAAVAENDPSGRTSPATSPRGGEESEIAYAVVSAMDRRFVRVSQIDDSDRLRPVDSVVAEGIAASIAQVGLLNPIIVCKMINQKSGRLYRLVAGGHRLQAVRDLGWDNVEVAICSANALERRSIEIAENFFRAEMSPLDQARFVTELIENEKARQGISADQDGRANNKRGGKKELEDDLRILRKSIGIQDVVAEKLGLSQQEVSRKMALNGIAPSFLPRVRALSLAGNAAQLRALAKMDTVHQDEVLKRIEAGVAKDVAAAEAMVKGWTAPDQAKKRASTFVSTFVRMGALEKMGALTLLGGYLPKGVSIVFDDAKTEASELLRPAKDVRTADEVALSKDMAALRAGTVGS